MMKYAIATVSCLLGLAAAAPVLADSPPSYARHEDVIRGRIAELPGRYSITVRDERGYLDDIRLHQGTVINPIGLTLAQGMRVTVYGYPDGRTFAATEIDTPYRKTQYYPEPAYVYPYLPAYAYPYGPYGYPYYSSTVIIDGGRGWGGRGWHGGYRRY